MMVTMESMMCMITPIVNLLKSGDINRTTMMTAAVTLILYISNQYGDDNTQEVIV